MGLRKNYDYPVLYSGRHYFMLHKYYGIGRQQHYQKGKFRIVKCNLGSICKINLGLINFIEFLIQNIRVFSPLYRNIMGWGRKFNTPVTWEHFFFAQQSTHR